MAKIHTIPVDFYGGKNPAPPEIQTQTRVAVPVATPKVAPRPQQTTAASLKKPAAVAPRPAWVLPVIIVGAVLVLGGGGFAAWWFLKTPPPAPVVVAPPEPVVAPPVVEEKVVSPPEPEVAPPPAPVNTSLIAAHIFTDSADSDADGVTDVEEEMLGTNPTLPDTDGDTYPDQTELLHLYNPIGIAPQRLMDAKLVNTYINPDLNYLIYYPKDWIPGALDAAKREVLFTASTGEYVEVRAVPFPAGQPFPEWFAQNLAGEDLTKYVPFKNRFMVSGIMSPDNTVALISDGANIYVVYYNGGSRAEINYRTTFRMMVESFKPAGTVTPLDLLPQQPVVPPSVTPPPVTPTEIVPTENVTTVPETPVLPPTPAEPTNPEPAPNTQ